ncbi:UDP-2,3-diacylglucosamine diphosphatase [bacterium]|nr:UDP-2,3-diacylglucosamine diphosphatase [bacterium]
MSGKKVYFASDFHLGVPAGKKSAERERLLVKWLDEIKQDAAMLFLVGDLFDFWHDYKTVVPKGFVLFLAKIKELTQMGVEVVIFTGNHDLWMFGYFEEELGAKVRKEPLQIDLFGKRFYIAHGDGLGPGDHGYKFIKKIFTNKLCQFAFRWIHPDLGIGLANFFSRKSREAEMGKEVVFLGEDKEWLVIHSKQILEKESVDYFVYGHRHLPIKFQLNNSVYINLGDWISHFTFGEFANNEFYLKKYMESGEHQLIDFVN